MTGVSAGLGTFGLYTPPYWYTAAAKVYEGRDSGDYIVAKIGTRDENDGLDQNFG